MQITAHINSIQKLITIRDNFDIFPCFLLILEAVSLKGAQSIEYATLYIKNIQNQLM